MTYQTEFISLSGITGITESCNPINTLASKNAIPDNEPGSFNYENTNTISVGYHFLEN
jgi:hypothetical protein